MVFEEGFFLGIVSGTFVFDLFGRASLETPLSLAPSTRDVSDTFGDSLLWHLSRDTCLTPFLGIDWFLRRIFLVIFFARACLFTCRYRLDSQRCIRVSKAARFKGWRGRMLVKERSCVKHTVST